MSVTWGNRCGKTKLQENSEASKLNRLLETVTEAVDYGEQLRGHGRQQSHDNRM